MNRYYPTNANQITYLGEVNHELRDQNTTYPADRPAIEIRMTPMTVSSINLGMRTPKNQSGLTLIELLVAMAVIAILVAIAAPNFSTITTGNRLVYESNELVALLNFARSEAITRNTQVRVLPATNAGTTVWENGWTIDWLDAATNTWTTLKQSGPMPTGIFTYTSYTHSTSITFNGTGGITTSAESFILCSPATTPNGKSIQVNQTGRIRSLEFLACP